MRVVVVGAGIAGLAFAVLRRLRIVDVELLMTSAMLRGASLVAAWLAANAWLSVLACFAILLGTAPTLRWLRERRARDD